MNINKVLNNITLYIDNNIEEKVDYNVLSRMMGVNNYTMQRIFSVITGIPLAEYIRKRKLSLAAYDLITGKYKVMDIAIKYGYENATSFSRAFETFHGIKPSEVSDNTKLHDFPRIIFDENVDIKNDFEYVVEHMPRLVLYGKSINTNNDTISEDAPLFFEKINNKYIDRFGNIKYGMVSYKDVEREEIVSYSVLYEKEIEDFEKIEIPESKWLKFTIYSKEAKDIQDMAHRFYKEFFPSTKYNLRDLPELEYYHDNVTEFYVPIY